MITRETSAAMTTIAPAQMLAHDAIDVRYGKWIRIPTGRIRSLRPATTTSSVMPRTLMISESLMVGPSIRLPECDPLLLRAPELPSPRSGFVGNEVKVDVYSR